MKELRKKELIDYHLQQAQILVAKLDFSNLTKKTSLIEVDEVEYARDKVETIDDYFQIYAGDGILSIKVKKGKNMFLRFNG